MRGPGKLPRIATAVTAAAILLSISLTAAPALAASAAPATPATAVGGVAPGEGSTPAVPKKARPKVGSATVHSASPPLRSMTVIKPPAAPKTTKPATPKAAKPATPKAAKTPAAKATKPAAPKKAQNGSPAAPKKAPSASPAAPAAGPKSPAAAPDLAAQPAATGSDLQTNNPLSDMPSFGANFNGLISDGDKINGAPSPGGAIGPDDYVQTVEASFAVYSKQGALEYGPASGSTLWQGFSGVCGQFYGNQFKVQYDEQAGRWVISGVYNAGGGGSTECLAVSQTSDPLGAWNRYAFAVSSGNVFVSSQSLAIWPDAYYLSAVVGGAQVVYAFQRAAMVAGQQAQDVSFTLGSQYTGLQPSGAEGGAQGLNPPAGAPDPFFMSCDAANGGPCSGDQLDEWDFHVDWTTPADSTFGTSSLAPSQTLPVDTFDSNLCDFNASCIPQPGTPQGLDPQSSHLASPVTYRNLGTSQALVLSQTVNVSPDPSQGNQAGIRWYELTNAGSGWTVGQQGTYAPDASSRWMSAAGIDASGDIAIGYSVSSSSVYPSIAVAGRLAGDPAGQLTQGEETLIAGGGSQTYQNESAPYSDNHWGPASSMTVDPADGCTFWFTSEYLPVTDPNSDTIRTGSFAFPGCTTGPRGQVSGTVTDAGTGQPVAGAQVATSLGATVTDSQGKYTQVLPAGSYDLTGSAWDYGSVTVTGAQVSSGATTTENLSLTAIPTVTLSGTVTDGSGHGYPLYAKIAIPGLPGGPVTTNPHTGQYSVSLPENQTFTATVSATLSGYQTVTRPITTGTADLTQNVQVPVDPATCSADGYALSATGTTVLNENFDDYSGDGGTTPPPGWTIQDNDGSGVNWSFNNPTGGGNQTGGTGNFAAIQSGDFHQDSSLVSPVFDLSGAATALLSFNTAYESFTNGQTGDVDISTDGGQTWTNVWHHDGGGDDVHGPSLQQIQIPQAAGHASVQIRFHFVAYAGGWWEVDNVAVQTRTCDPVPGGLVVGSVTDANTGAALGGLPVTLTDTPPLSENFDDYSGDGAAAPPPGWTVQDNEGNGEVWSFGNPQGLGNRTGGIKNFATLDAYDFTPGDSQDTSLVSPVINLTGESNPLLSFSNDYESQGLSTAEVDVSTDGGQTWTSIWQQSDFSVNGPDQEQIPIPQAAGQADVQVRFHYTGTSIEYFNDPDFFFAGIWQIDDVTVGHPAVQASTASAPLTQGASLLPTGYYQFFDPMTGSQPFTTADPGYVTGSQTVSVAANATTEADFSLAAPRLSVSAPGISATQVLGATTTKTLTVTNDGTAPATVTLDQRNGISQVLSQQGAPLNLVQPAQPLSVVTPADGSSPPSASKASGGSGTATPAAGGATPATGGGVPAGLAWQPIAPYPSTIEDAATAYGNGIVYSVGGFHVNSQGFYETLGTVYAYNTATNAWTQLKNLPVALDTPSAAFVNGKLYVVDGDGSNNVLSSALYVYNPATNAWSTAAVNPHPAASAAVAVVGSTIYLVGGCADDFLACDAQATAEAYNTTTNAWSTVANYPHPVSWESCGGISGKVYCAGGATDTGYDVDGYVLSPSANTWSPIAALPTSVWGSAYDAASGLLVLTDGVFGGDISNQGLAYDPTTNTWTALPDNYYTLYRAGGACGFYQIGGDIGGFNAQTFTDELPGLNGCVGTTQPWLGVTGGSNLTLQPGQSATVTVTLAATTADKVTQPGTFFAQLGVENNTPYAVTPVNITMTVTPPSGWGEVTGAVTGTTCSGTSGPVSGAQIQAIGKKYTLGLTAGLDGSYTLWAPSSGNPFQLVATRNGWKPTVAKVTVKVGGTVTANFTLSAIC